MNFKEVFLFVLVSIALSVASSVVFEFVAKPYLLKKKEEKENENLSISI